MRRFVESCGSRSLHPDLHTTRMEKDEHAVSAVVNVVENWIDPFAIENELMIISTGKVATPNVKSDLMNALKVGEKNMKTSRRRGLKTFPLQRNSMSP